MAGTCAVRKTAPGKRKGKHVANDAVTSLQAEQDRRIAEKFEGNSVAKSAPISKHPT